MLGTNELVDDNGRVAARDTGEREEMAAQLVVRAVGYRGVQLTGLPFDDRGGTIPHTNKDVEGRRNEYVVGWIKRGPTGVIGSNKSDSQETVDTLVKDLSDAQLQISGPTMPNSWPSGWWNGSRRSSPTTRSDRCPRTLVGEPHGRPRVKLTSVADLLRIGHG